MSVMHKELSKVLRIQQGTRQELTLCPQRAYIRGRETDNIQKKISLMYSLPYVAKHHEEGREGAWENLGLSLSVRWSGRALLRS